MEKVINGKKYEVYVLKIDLLDVGHITNTYIIKDKKSNECMVIDPSFNGKYILESIDKVEGKLVKIYLTHCHGDHISALEEMLDVCKNVEVLIHENDKDGIFDDRKNCKYILTVPNFSHIKQEDITVVKEKDIVKVGSAEFEVIHSPGHTNGSSMLYEKEENILFSGDTIFSDCFGRCDLKSGSIEDMKNTLKKVFARFENASNVLAFSGHGDKAYLEDIKERFKKMNILD